MKFSYSCTMKSILGKTCVRADRDERQIVRCREVLKKTVEETASTARILGLVGNEVRLKILLLINSEGKLCVCDLSDVLNMKIPAVSQHLRKLKDAGILYTEREGTVIYYQVRDAACSVVEDILSLVGHDKYALSL